GRKRERERKERRRKPPEQCDGNPRCSLTSRLPKHAEGLLSQPFGFPHFNGQRLQSPTISTGNDQGELSKKRRLCAAGTLPIAERKPTLNTGTWRKFYWRNTQRCWSLHPLPLKRISSSKLGKEYVPNRLRYFLRITSSSSQVASSNEWCCHNTFTSEILFV